MTSMFAGSSIGRALIGAALLLTASAALAFASPELIDEDLARRLWGVLLGAVVVIYANAAPKVLPPLRGMRCDPATEQSVRRFSGWAIVAGGLGFAGAWLFVPLQSAAVVAMALLGTSLLLVLLRWGWALRARGSGSRV